MKYILTFTFLFISVMIFSQRQFSVVCNENESKFEVIIMGEEKPFHKIVKDRFPNQRAAEIYLSENGPNLVCGNRDPNTPPPTTAGRRNVTTRTNNSSSTSTIQPAQSKYYNRNFRIIGSVTKIFSLDKLYVGNLPNSNQTLGYNIGAEFTFGRSVQVGAGIHYVNLYGPFEEIQLDIDFDDPEYFGAIQAYKLEGILKTPILMKNNSWFLFEFGLGYYTDVKPSTSLELDDLVPLLNDGFYGMRWGLGRDNSGFNFMLSGEWIFGITDEDYVEKDSFFQLKLGLGFAF